MTDIRPLRGCDICGQVDDHPRHIFDALGSEEYSLSAPESAFKVLYGMTSVPVEDIVRIANEMADGATQCRHMDCCREAGCPTGDCDNAPKKTGLALVEAIVGRKSNA